MGLYVDDNLMPNEQVVHAAHVSNVIYVPYLLITLLVTAIAALAGEFALPVGLLATLIAVVGIILCETRKHTTEIAVTNKRLILKTGLITRETVEQFLEKIDSISIEQTILERLTNSGTIIVRGSGQTFSPITNIDSPLAFRKTVNEQADRIKSGRSS